MRSNPCYLLERTINGQTALNQQRVLKELLACRAIVTEATLRYLRRLGLTIPHSDRQCLFSQPRGVVALLYHIESQRGMVSYLRAEPADDWHVPRNLPFTPDQLRLALSRLLGVAGFDLAELASELYAFRVSDTAGDRAVGTSMTVAALLAVVLGQQQAHAPTSPPAVDPMFRAVACTVEFAEDSERPVSSNVALRSVGQVAAKLEAFRREIGRGSLLVAHPTCPDARRFRRYFDTVWSVESLQDLADHLDRKHLLDPFRHRAPLEAEPLRRAVRRLQRMANDEHRYRDALDLSEALLKHRRAASVRPEIVYQLHCLRADVLRHLGYFQQAGAAAQGGRRNRNSSYNSRAQADVRLAAALFDGHSFDRARRLLRPWADRLRREAGLVEPETAVQVFNTLGRVEAILQGDFEPCFEASYRLQSHLYRYDTARTLCYWIHALLRRGRLREAGRRLHLASRRAEFDPFAQRMLDFLQADLARRRGLLWVSQRDGQALKPPQPGPTGHPTGMYLLATARQPQRSVDDCARRLDRAAEWFTLDLGAPSREPQGGNLLVFLAAAGRLRAAAARDDRRAWSEARRDLRQFIRRRGHEGFASYYGPVLGQLGRLPSVPQAEALLEAVPYF
jgi:hypothetical protein